MFLLISSFATFLAHIYMQCIEQVSIFSHHQVIFGNFSKFRFCFTDIYVGLSLTIFLQEPVNQKGFRCLTLGG